VSHARLTTASKKEREKKGKLHRANLLDAIFAEGCRVKSSVCSVDLRRTRFQTQFSQTLYKKIRTRSAFCSNGRGTKRKRKAKDIDSGADGEMLEKVTDRTANAQYRWG
jgi:hypothetical protein